MQTQSHGRLDGTVTSNTRLRPSRTVGDAVVTTGVAESERGTVTTRAEGGILAELALDHPSLPLVPSLERAPGVTVEPEYTTTSTSGRSIAYVTAYGSGFDAFETALGMDPTVTEPTLVDRYEDRRVYRIALTNEAIRILPLTTEVDARVLDRSCTRDGWRIQLQLPDRDALVAFNGRCGDRDISVTVNHLRVSDDDEDGVISLTRKQEKLLTMAYEEGYFEVPRGISQDELAEKIGVSKSAVSQRMRRALGELCAASLGTTTD